MALSSPSSVEVFATAAVRDNRIPNPTVGQACVLLDSGDFLIYYGPTNGWCPPWNTAWGEVAEVEITSPVNVWDSASWGSVSHPGSNYRSPLAGLSVNFVAQYNRRYELVFDGEWDSNANGDIISIYMYLTPASQTQILGHVGMTPKPATNTGTAPEPVRFKWRIGDPTIDGVLALLPGQTYTAFIAAGQVFGSAGQIVGGSVYVSSITVTDVGPIGSPK